MIKSKTALITGICGQDGTYLAELLASNHYRVVGISRSKSDCSALLQGIEVIEGDVATEGVIEKALAGFKPDEIYNLAAISSIGESWRHPALTFRLNAQVPMIIMDFIRKELSGTRFFQASSSEIFGDTNESPQTELSWCQPRNPYGSAKLAAHQAVCQMREYFGIFAVSGILYNHESPRRPRYFVTRKITRAAAKIKLGLADSLFLEDLSARRDWGYAGDYVEAMHLIMQAEVPRDYIIATGETHSVRDFVDAAFAYLDLDADKYVRTDLSFVRTPDSVELRGDISGIGADLGWSPRVSFPDLVKQMVDNDLTELKINN